MCRRRRQVGHFEVEGRVDLSRTCAKSPTTRFATFPGLSRSTFALTALDEISAHHHHKIASVDDSLIGDADRRYGSACSGTVTGPQAWDCSR